VLVEGVGGIAGKSSVAAACNPESPPQPSAKNIPKAHINKRCDFVNPAIDPMF
jgi:hypothetical protein